MKLSTTEGIMNIDISSLILDLLKKRNTITTSDIVHRTGFSRAYIHRYFKELQDTGKIILIGKADKARYVLASKKANESAQAERRHFLRTYRNRDLQEDQVWDNIVKQTGILFGAHENVRRIVEYGFTEMLNNAIDHSRSQSVRVRVLRTEKDIRFSVVDKGIGIFRNIKEQRKLHNEREAIQDLLKGKQTTAPEIHSGEGIFFTSRAADQLVIKSSGKRIIFDSRIHDVAIDKTTVKKGTTVDFMIELKSNKNLASIFSHYTGEEYEFSKTEVQIALYKAGGAFISRSQARRMLVGMGKFNHLVLDFQKVATIGQGFADEIFRIWKRNNPKAIVEVRHANENIKMMIAHVQKMETESEK
jgi:anti-sigma regulatory factor (Ser/Thr protein kinase)/uncharacterized protein (DUF1330 family)/predicted transcriptional regulator